MEKYGVEQEDREKVAKDKKGKDTCPECDTPLEDQTKTGVAKCPVHGTKPFEKKDD